MDMEAELAFVAARILLGPRREDGKIALKIQERLDSTHATDDVKRAWDMAAAAFVREFNKAMGAPILDHGQSGPEGGMPLTRQAVADSVG